MDNQFPNEADTVTRAVADAIATSGFTEEQVAHEIGVTVHDFQTWLAGDADMPYMVILEVVDLLGLRLTDLLAVKS